MMEWRVGQRLWMKYWVLTSLPIGRLHFLLAQAVLQGGVRGAERPGGADLGQPVALRFGPLPTIYEMKNG